MAEPVEPWEAEDSRVPRRDLHWAENLVFPPGWVGPWGSRRAAPAAMTAPPTAPKSTRGSVVTRTAPPAVPPTIRVVVVVVVLRPLREEVP